MSYRASAAALALQEVSTGERLVAFSLASYANSDQQAWPSDEVAAARAGLARSRYLAARHALAERGLIRIEHTGRGRGKSSLVSLLLAEHGSGRDGEINAELFEAVLSSCRTRGSERLLLAALAALSDPIGLVIDLSTEELRAAAGLSDRSYRRAREQLLAGTEVELEQPGGGRAKTNRWLVHDPRITGGDAPIDPRPRRPRRSSGHNRPLLVSQSSEPMTSGSQRSAETPVNTGPFHRKPRQKPRRPTCARERSLGTLEPHPPTPTTRPPSGSQTRTPRRSGMQDRSVRSSWRRGRRCSASSSQPSTAAIRRAGTRSPVGCAPALTRPAASGVCADARGRDHRLPGHDAAEVRPRRGPAAGPPQRPAEQATDQRSSRRRWLVTSSGTDRRERSDATDATTADAPSRTWPVSTHSWSRS
jgi:hypothetical protein